MTASTSARPQNPFLSSPIRATHLLTLLKLRHLFSGNHIANKVIPHSIRCTQEGIGRTIASEIFPEQSLMTQARISRFFNSTGIPMRLVTSVEPGNIGSKLNCNKKCSRRLHSRNQTTMYNCSCPTVVCSKATSRNNISRREKQISGSTISGPAYHQKYLSRPVHFRTSGQGEIKSNSEQSEPPELVMFLKVLSTSLEVYLNDWNPPEMI